jgi:hypothetical protein
VANRALPFAQFFRPAICFEIALGSEMDPKRLDKPCFWLAEAAQTVLQCCTQTRKTTYGQTANAFLG